LRNLPLLRITQAEVFRNPTLSSLALCLSLRFTAKRRINLSLTTPFSHSTDGPADTAACQGSSSTDSCTERKGRKKRGHQTLLHLKNSKHAGMPHAESSTLKKKMGASCGTQSILRFLHWRRGARESCNLLVCGEAVALTLKLYMTGIAVELVVAQ
jgi:hypothetical protein